jgi:hypothetical protein
MTVPQSASLIHSYMNMLQVFKGDPETLEKFITGVDPCLSLYPANSYTYILNIVLAMKMNNSMR